MKRGLTKAWMAGAGVLAVAFGGWSLLLGQEIYSEPMAIGLGLSPVLAGYATSYLAPSHKFVLGVSLALPSALLVVALNSALQVYGGPVDFPGFGGGLILFVLALVGSTALASLGSVVGYVHTRGRR
jgi:hypothetical protein